MKSNFIHVCFIIDESSSMWTSVSDVKGGFQKIIDEQKANENGWSTRSNIIIGKLVNGETSRNLISKKSLTNWKVYKDFFKYA